MSMFTHAFMIRALVAGISISVCAALLGVSLVLKRFSMIGDGLSHVGFGTMAIALAVGWAPLAVAIPVCVASSFLLLRISSNSSVKGDAAIALISNSALAIGILVTSMTSGLNTDVTSFMFGSILAISESDMWLSVVLGVVVVTMFVVLYHTIFLVTFDEQFATASGARTDFFNGLIAVLTALTIVIGMRLMGAMMISSLIVFPALSAMRVFKSFKRVVLSAALISVTCFVAGIAASFYLATPAGASIVVADLLAFGICWCIGRFRK